jgi:AraC-like DNA-binding protein
MLIVFEDRPSDSPVIDRVWRSHSDKAGTFRSMASCSWGMVVTRHGGRTYLTVRGPETRATAAECPADGEWVGAHFKLGTFMPALPPGRLRDRNDVTLPGASPRTFQLDGSRWEYPGFDNFETFVHRLVKAGLIARAHSVEDALEGDPTQVGRRTLQRHFLRATGMPSRTIVQIELARQATRLLKRGLSILDVTHRLGYYDQAHLTRSLRHFVGLTPAAIARGEEQLSLLYNTSAPDPAILQTGARHLRCAEAQAMETRHREERTWTRFRHYSSGPGGS